MAAAHIPAKQLTYKGTYAELSAKLLERETGWCTDDNILYVKGENGLVPLSKVVVIDDSATPEIVQHYVDGGITPIMKAEGTFLYLQGVGQVTAWFMGAEPGQLIFKKWEDDGNFWATETVPLQDHAKPHVYIWEGMAAEQIWDIVLEAMGSPDPNGNAPLALLADGGTYAIFPYVITQFNMDLDAGTYTYGLIFSATYNDTIETRICNLELDLYTDEVKGVTWAPPEIISPLSDAPSDGNAYFRKNGEWVTPLGLDSASSTEEIASGNIAIQIGSGEVTIAGKAYRTVTIGNQEWLAENLDVELGAIGTDCFMYNNDPEMRAKYGLLYKWSALCSGNGQMSAALTSILPEGWRLPSREDFLELQEASGGIRKLMSTSGWEEDYYTEGGGGTDDYGFTALPAGERDYDSFRRMGSSTYFWSATWRNNSSFAYYFLIGNRNWNVHYRESYYAQSVRLVRDNAPRTVKATVQEIVKAGTDSELSATSENPVQNKVIYEAIGNVEALLAAL